MSTGTPGGRIRMRQFQAGQCAMDRSPTAAFHMVCGVYGDITVGSGGVNLSPAFYSAASYVPFVTFGNFLGQTPSPSVKRNTGSQIAITANTGVVLTGPIPAYYLAVGALTDVSNGTPGGRLRHRQLAAGQCAMDRSPTAAFHMVCGSIVLDANGKATINLSPGFYSATSYVVLASLQTASTVYALSATALTGNQFAIAGNPGDAGRTVHYLAVGSLTDISTGTPGGRLKHWQVAAGACSMTRPSSAALHMVAGIVTLPASGSYLVRVSPAFYDTSSYVVMLTNQSAGALVPSIVALNTSNQFTITGTAGMSVGYVAVGALAD